MTHCTRVNFSTRTVTIYFCTPLTVHYSYGMLTLPHAHRTCPVHSPFPSLPSPLTPHPSLPLHHPLFPNSHTHCRILVSVVQPLPCPLSCTAVLQSHALLKEEWGHHLQARDKTAMKLHSNYMHTWLSSC